MTDNRVLDVGARRAMPEAGPTVGGRWLVQEWNGGAWSDVVAVAMGPGAAKAMLANLRQGSQIWPPGLKIIEDDPSTPRLPIVYDTADDDS